MWRKLTFDLPLCKRPDPSCDDNGALAVTTAMIAAITTAITTAMTTAKITRKEGYQCAPSGAFVVTFPFGAIVEGQVAEWALSDHAASRMFDPRSDTQAATVPETKAPRGRPRKVAK